MAEMVRAVAVISGRVQGVLYRMETQRAAQRYGVSGWVRNRRDGTVESVMEGESTKVQSLLEWCKDGPPAAHVAAVDVRWETYTGEHDGFGVRY